MKKLHFLLITALILLSSCHKDDDPIAPIDQLPPATQTGAGTFGCLVNGKPFIDDSGSLNCFYQFVNGGYYFGINGDDEIGNLVSISIGTYNKELEENQIYPLTEAQDENAWGGGISTSLEILVNLAQQILTIQEL